MDIILLVLIDFFKKVKKMKKKKSALSFAIYDPLTVKLKLLIDFVLNLINSFVMSFAL